MNGSLMKRATEALIAGPQKMKGEHENGKGFSAKHVFYSTAGTVRSSEYLEERYDLQITTSCLSATQKGIGFPKYDFEVFSVSRQIEAFILIGLREFRVERPPITMVGK